MSKELFTAYWWVLIIFCFADRVVHYFAIYPYLKSRGIHPPLGWYSNFIGADVAAYKTARLCAGEPLTWWYVFRAIRILAWMLAIGGLYLICRRSGQFLCLTLQVIRS